MQLYPFSEFGNGDAAGPRPDGEHGEAGRTHEGSRLLRRYHEHLGQSIGVDSEGVGGHFAANSLRSAATFLGSNLSLSI